MVHMICSVGLKDTYGNKTTGFEHFASITFLSQKALFHYQAYIFEVLKKY